MITVENNYEPIIYEQPFSSHIYENQSELLHDYYTRPIKNNSQITQEVNEINIVIKPDKKDDVQCSNTNHIYKKHTKRTTKRKNFDNSISLREPKK